YTHGDLAYMAGLGVFMGRLPAVRSRWYFQAFLAGLTVASGSRVSACALIVIWGAIQLCGARDFPLRISAVGAAAVVLALFVENSTSWDFGAGIHHSLQAIYGRESLAQSPWE